MTSRDPMPFGKFGKGKGNLTLGQVKTEQPDYVKWLLDQDGFATKNPALYKFFTEGEETTSSPEERRVITRESDLLGPMSVPFRAWWARAYGERLRTQGEHNYVAYLRVAIEAWTAAEKMVADTVLLHPPLAKQTDPLKAELKQVKPDNDLVDPDGNVNF